MFQKLMVSLANNQTQSLALLIVCEGEHATDGRLVRILTPSGQVFLTSPSSHVITMDLHASQIQGLFLPPAPNFSKLLIIPGFFNVPVCQIPVPKGLLLLTLRPRSTISTPR